MGHGPIAWLRNIESDSDCDCPLADKVFPFHYNKVFRYLWVGSSDSKPFLVPLPTVKLVRLAMLRNMGEHTDKALILTATKVNVVERCILLLTRLMS